MRLLIALLGFAVFAGPSFANEALVSHQTIVVRALNRLKGQVKEFKVPAGENVLFENISITARSCYHRRTGHDLVPSYWGYLEIKDLEKEMNDVENSAHFSGWMNAINRSVSALEDPIYDVWVVSCED